MISERAAALHRALPFSARLGIPLLAKGRKLLGQAGFFLGGTGFPPKKYFSGLGICHLRPTRGSRGRSPEKSSRNLCKGREGRIFEATGCRSVHTNRPPPGSHANDSVKTDLKMFQKGVNCSPLPTMPRGSLPAGSTR